MTPASPAPPPAAPPADCGCGSADPVECARQAARDRDLAMRHADEARQKLASVTRQAAEFLRAGGRERIDELEQALRTIRDGTLSGTSARAVALAVLNEDPQ